MKISILIFFVATSFGLIASTASYGFTVSTSCPGSLDYPSLCLSPKFSVGGIYQHKGSNDVYGLYLESYGGLHITKHISLHGLGGFTYQEAGMLTQVSKVPHQLFLQIGHFASSPISLSIGRLQSLFGLDVRLYPFLFHHMQASNILWQTQKFGLRVLSYPSPDLSIELSSVLDSLKDVESKEVKDEAQYLIRIIKDISHLSGSRFILSALHQRRIETRLGAAFFSDSLAHGVISFEWIRTWNLINHPTAHESQFTRISYKEPEDKKDRFIFSFEDFKPAHWQTTIGVDHRLTTHLNAVPTVSVVRSRVLPKEFRYIATFSLEGRF